MAKGWILLHRQIQESFIWVDKEPFDRRSAWLDLLLMANYEEKNIVVRGKSVTIGRGQRFTSTLHLADKWNWSVNRVRRYLELLETLQMITTDRTPNGIIITIVKYNDYQIARITNETPNEIYNGITDETTNGITDSTQTNKEKKVKKEINNKYIYAFDAFWKIYPRKNDKARAYKCYLARLNDGYTEDQLLTACKNYAAECERNKTEQRYIKHGATFLSVNEPFLDYLKDEKGVSNDNMGRILADDEEQRNREIDEQIRRVEAGELDAEDEEFRRMWDE